MSLENISVQEAVKNLEQMKRAISRVEKNKRKNSLFARNKTGLLLQTGCAFLAAPFLIIEAYSGQLTREFLYSAKDTVYREGGLISLGGFLASLIVITYLILLDSAKKSNEQLTDYVARNFLALSFLSLFSDLFVKFAGLCFVILAPRPEWVAPLLLLYTADYLFQGRLFTLPFALTLVAALTCIGTAGYQFYIQSPSLLPALSIFTALVLASIIFTVRNVQKKEEV